MTMSDNEVQSANPKQEGLKTVTENGFSGGQEVNKVKDPADGGGSMLEETDHKSSGGENCAYPNNEQSPDQRKPKRCISFPKDSCVSGYCDPPDPWKQAPKWTAQDVLSAYKKSCEKHGTKPLSKIIQQIEALSCSGKRAEKLILKGEKIDMKQCETFEEILRRVQFKTIDLESCHLDDETAVAWFDMIEYYESTCHLNISFNKNIGVRGWQACSRLIRRTPCLTTLDLRNCDMNDRSIPIFGRALKLGSHLTVLHMENMYLSGRSLILLVAALKMNEILQELFLADNRLMPSDGIQLGNLLKYNHSLTLLDLRNNHLQDVGVGHVCDGLYEQNLDKGLRTLVLWNNQVTYQAMASLSRALGSTKCLETLNLGHNNVTNEGIHILKEGLLKSKSLMRLGLQATRLTCEGAVALAEYVADSVHLLRLDLRENDIKTAGLMALSLALKVNESVTRMDIDKETKKESGMKDYAEQQRRLQQEIQGCMERNQQTVLRREEEERRRLEERAQVEMAARASVQSAITSAQEAIQAHPEMIYDPTPSPEPENKRRPSLLFQAHRLTPQESLESPHSSEVDFFSGKTKGENPEAVVASVAVTVSSPPLTLELPNPLTSQASAVMASQNSSDGAGMALPLSKPIMSRIRSPPSELLLSPQYYPKPTARKIFSVSRVVETSVASPTVSKTGVLDTGATGTSNTPAMKLSGGGGSVTGGAPSPISPTLLCQDLSVKTVNDYIQQIVADPQLHTPSDGESSGVYAGGDPMEGEEGVVQKSTGQSVFPEKEEEKTGGGSMDPLGVMQVEASPSPSPSPAGGVQASSSLSCDSTHGNDSTPPSLGDRDTTDTDNPPTHSQGEETVSREGGVATDTALGVVSTDSDLHNIPQSSEVVVDIGDGASASSVGTAGHSAPLPVPGQSDEPVSLPPEGVEGELGSQTPSVGEAAGTKTTKADTKEQAQSQPVQSDPKDSSLFRTMEFPEFDINEEDLSLFGVSNSRTTASGPATTTTTTTVTAATAATGGENAGKGRPEGREVSPGLGDTWTTVDASALGGEEEEEGEEEPGFFTSLSMNGLTQELASVLNSIDGKADLDSQETPCAASVGEGLQNSAESDGNQSTA
ncbi:uncharacterized protein LOC143295828 isoform X2 [Babylonia areolata]|uniref:uncharacterized protein LOC143295828 isoform X2 n=1 Tax=Babylonia areolata TaxID=304850 RepID=UPI003FD15D1C